MTGPPAQPVIGRVPELARLHALVRQVREGRGAAVLVEGEAGIGKSLTVRVGLAGAEGLGCRVLRGAADEFAGPIPLRVFTDCFATAGFAEGGPARTLVADPVREATERVLRTVDTLCASAPLVLLVDDLQWADEQSLRVWDRLSRLVGQLPLLLVGVLRLTHLRPEVAELRRTLKARDAVVMRLGPLSRAEGAELVAALAGAPPGPGLRQLADRCGGNPLHLRELLDVLQRDDRLRVQPAVRAEVERPQAEQVPTLRAAIGDRLAALPEETQRVLRTAALLGIEFSPGDLAAVLGRAPERLAGVLAEACRADVLVETGRTVAFRHPLVRKALYDAIPAGVRAALHRQAAEALAGAGVATERVAGQLTLAGGVRDSWTLDWLAAHAGALIQQAPQPAIALLSEAVGQLRPADPRRAALESRLVAALRMTLSFDEVRRLTRAALDSGSGSIEHRLEMAWSLSYALLLRNPAEAAVVAREALADFGDGAGRWGARLSALYAVILTVDDRRETEAGEAVAAAILAGERAGDRWTRAYALHAKALLTGRRDVPEAAAVMREALDVIGDDEELTELRVIVLSNLVQRLAEQCRPAEAAAALGEALILAETRPSASMVRVNCTAAERHYETGRWDDALLELNAIDVGLEYSYLALESGSVRALIALHRDEPAVANAELRRLSAMRWHGEVMRNHGGRYSVARALAEEREGRLDRGVAILSALLDPVLDPAQSIDVHGRWEWLPDLVRIAVAAGERDVAEAGTRMAVEDAESEGLPIQQAMASYCRGLLAGDGPLLLEAADRYGRLDRAFDQANAWAHAALGFARRDDESSARKAFAAAVERYTDLGAKWDFDRVTTRMAEFGPRYRLPARAHRPDNGWAALTTTEVRVSGLVADGLPNPEIAERLLLSRRAVQAHLGHILTKLGLGSRGELATEAVRHRPDPEPACCE